MSDIEFLTDWLGNEFRVGDRVIYSSSSQRTGINFGIVERIDAVDRKVYRGNGEYGTQSEKRVKIRPEKSSNYRVDTNWAVTLLARDGAFRSITKWPTV